jgi:peroxiredoxin/mono/diheme cytochrome c family protein
VLPALTILTAVALSAPDRTGRKVTPPESVGTKRPRPPGPGAAVPSFTLPDVHRRRRSPEHFKGKKAFVVVFLGTECPLANLYLPTLAGLHREYAGKGVQFLAVNSNSQDSFLAVSAHAQERSVPFPVLKDFDHRVADAFGATRTPEAFLLDARRVIRYHGRIDDQYGIGFRRARPAVRHLKDALDELLAGKAVTTAQTEPSGCLIGRAGRPGVKGEVTYARQVSRILQKRCQECHRPGEIGPFSLLTYDDAKAWAGTIAEVVREERMPPWHADPRHGKFANDRRLSREEAAALREWVRRGCPKGDDKDLPPKAKFPAGWKVGKPDAVFRMAGEFKVPATGVLPYKRFTVDPGFKKDVWVQAAECRPGNPRVVHHILVYLRAPGKPLYAADGTASTLVGWAPGDMPALYPPGTAKRVPAGSKLVFEVHYTPDGTEQTDRSSVGVIFARKPPEREVETNILANLGIRIPPRAADYRSELTYTFRKDALLLSFMPHMHLRGVSAKYVATYPGGRTETLLSVPDYDFGWQSVYRFAKPLRIPRGTKLRWVGTWDNSADNPRNPDPSKEVRWGLQTWDEMHNGWMEVVWQKPGKGP